MNSVSEDSVAQERVQALYLERLFAQRAQTDRMFVWLLLFQFVAGIVMALVVSPVTWAGSRSSLHLHVVLALLLGATLSLPPIVLVRRSPGSPLTRQMIAVSQMLWSALLIHLSGGRIETHFHIFGSLAFLAFYRDIRVLVTATAVVTADHLLRGIYLPESVYGVLSPSSWRWVEHAAWVVFEDTVLVHYCLRGRRELREMCARQVQAESMAASIEQVVVKRTAQLEAANNSLEGARTFLQEVYRAVPGALLVLDSSDRIRVINDGAKELLQAQEAEILGQSLASFFLDGEELSYGKLTERARNDELPRTEQTCRSTNGASVPVLFSARRLPPGGFGDRSFVCVALDIRERKKLEAELHQKQKLESLGQLAAGIAHEINTPTQFVSDNARFLRSTFEELAPLLSGCSAIRSPDEDPPATLRSLAEAVARIDLAFINAEVPKALEDSLEGLERISEIVRAMKEFSHPGAKGMVPVDINRSVRSTATVARNEWKYVAEMEFDLEADLPQVTCLPNELNQVLLNMIVNAAHAIETARQERETDELGRIRISTRACGSDVEIRISDTGCGIPPEIRTRIYDPFFTTKEVGKGTGQGMAIAHNVVVERHKGRIGLESEVGVGTTFIVSLPMEPARAAEAA